MASILISELGKLISGHPPETTFALLKTRLYLSEAALSQPDAVMAALQQILDKWPAEPGLGAEPWRTQEFVLAAKGYLNTAGLEATKRYVSRN